MGGLRYTTFGPGELDAEIRRLTRLRSTGDEPAPDTAVEGVPPTEPPAGQTDRQSGKLLKAHSVAVAYPDETTGACLYERLGPACHRFDYRYGEGARLHRAYVSRPLENTTGAIERTAIDGAAEAFRHAVAAERKDRFRRITEPADGSRVKDPGKRQMGAKAANEQAGKYALCRRLGQRLIPASCLFETIEEANDAWVAAGNPDYSVACCDRLDRCWEVPKYNPMPGRGAGHAVG